LFPKKKVKLQGCKFALNLEFSRADGFCLVKAKFKSVGKNIDFVQLKVLVFPKAKSEGKNIDFAQ